MTNPTQEKKSPGKSDEREMPFLDHLEELRWRIFKSIIIVVVLAILSYVFIETIFAFLVAPYNEAVQITMQNQADGAEITPPKLVFLNPTGGFMVHLKLAGTAGLILSLPFILYQIWQFVAPGLLAHERRFGPVLVLSTIFCFLVGAAFCYYVVLRYGLSFLLGFQSETLVPMISIEEYFGFVVALVFIFGAVFEMPVLAFFLTRLGILTPEFLRHKRRYGIVVIFIAAAVLTPTVDAFTQILLAAPLLLLYEVSIWVSKLALPAEVKSALREVATT